MQFVRPHTPVILLGDHGTAGHLDDLATQAGRHGYRVEETFSFGGGEAASADELDEVEAVVAALGRAIVARLDVWVPFPGPDFGREQHWRRLSLVLQRHGLNLRICRDLDPVADTGGYSEIDFALRREVQSVDALDQAALAAVGAKSLGQEIERVLAAAAPANRRASADTGAEAAPAPILPAPTVPWSQRQPMLKRYVHWLVHGCGVTQAATARVLNSTGQRTPKGRQWQPGTVSALLNGRYDHGVRAVR